MADSFLLVRRAMVSGLPLESLDSLHAATGDCETVCACEVCVVVRCPVGVFYVLLGT